MTRRTPDPSAEVDAYRRRIRELRAERIELANGQGEQLTFDVGPLADMVDIRAAAARSTRRRGWVQS